MRYKKRHLERKFLEMSNSFKAVMLTGSRQVGKTTMLKHLAKNTDRTFVTLDDIDARNLAKNDSALFFQKYPLPILIDEIQKAPELFERIKIICDKTTRKGQIWMTGSESARLRKLAGESLAGRVCVLKMYPFSYREYLELEYCEVQYCNDCFQKIIDNSPKKSINDIFDFIIKGGMPELDGLSEEAIYNYYNSYVNNYLIRDVSEDFGLTNINAFINFTKICASNIARLLNVSKLAKEAGITVNTAKSWLDVLQSLNIIYLLYPYQKTLGKRLTKMPKIYFTDSGLSCFLTSWQTRDTLLNGAESGHYFENFVVTEFIKHYSSSKNHVDLYFYRDKDKNEVDLVINADGSRNIFEIKKSTKVHTDDLRPIKIAKKNISSVNYAGFLCMRDDLFPIKEDVFMIPAYIL